MNISQLSIFSGETLTRMPETRKIIVFSFIMHEQAEVYDREQEAELIKMVRILVFLYFPSRSL